VRDTDQSYTQKPKRGARPMVKKPVEQTSLKSPVGVTDDEDIVDEDEVEMDAPAPAPAAQSTRRRLAEIQEERELARLTRDPY
jgi:hypothetical protein